MERFAGQSLNLVRRPEPSMALQRLWFDSNVLGLCLRHGEWMKRGERRQNFLEVRETNRLRRSH